MSRRVPLRQDCPIFEDVLFDDIRVKGAVRAGDIAGFKGDLLSGLRFRNLTFETTPATSWTCGYVDLDTFSAVDVSPPITCSTGPSGEPSGSCAAGLRATGCAYDTSPRDDLCQKCLGCPDWRCQTIGVKAKAAGCTAPMINYWCHNLP